ncbi:DUF1566 domain-containing protein (plasmid) [Vibrio campbellii]|uniref:Lcl C-terminal domain-containing protein n=1 Tax=Vibrio campbellii TaxID=680 RepID=UPI001F08460A|nr:DUF1566 domain-containing protein [Vibrio campbellii]UMM06823.1 DUF1566 domain-containing protein [Vibrio campbellii]
MKKITISLCLAAAFSTVAMAQTCKPESITPTQPAGQFLDNNDGTITDIVNGLMWTKCSLGQVYKNGTCTGTPSNVETWQDALIAAANWKQNAKTSDWRLPNIKELSSLVERSCVSPAINLSVFPSTPSAAYWSNTFDSKNVNPTPGIEGRIVDFTDGTEFLTDVNRHRLIRLVRDLKGN